MRIKIALTLLLCIAFAIIPRLQIQSLKNKAIMQARDIGDTLIARINNKLYYTVKADGSYQVTDDSVVENIIKRKGTENLYLKVSEL